MVSSINQKSKEGKKQGKEIAKCFLSTKQIDLTYYLTSTSKRVIRLNEDLIIQNL